MKCYSWLIAIIFIVISPSIGFGSRESAESITPIEDDETNSFRSVKSIHRHHRHRHQPAHHIDRQFIDDDSLYEHFKLADNENEKIRSKATAITTTKPSMRIDDTKNFIRLRNRKNSSHQRQVHWQKNHKNGN